jgi:DNA-binding transcriptional ArsR family regulator
MAHLQRVKTRSPSTDPQQARLTTAPDTTVWLYSVQIASPDPERVFRALADQTRRDIVRRAISAEEGVLELARHYSMSFAAVQKHVAVLERAGLITKQRIGRRKVVRTNLEAVLVARRLLDQYEELWRARIGGMIELTAETDGATETVGTGEGKR